MRASVKAVVSIVMPVFNRQRFLREAVQSVLCQTLRDFELIVVDDGSTDGGSKIVESFQDGRIRLVRLERNSGSAAAMNAGLDLARGHYVARMDADDICVPSRLERQVEFMERNPSIGISGAWARMFGAKTGVVERPTEDASIKCELLFNCVLNHPTVIMRRQPLIDGGVRYDPTFKTCEDFDLWARVAPDVEFANLPQVLLHYRVHAMQTTATDCPSQRANCLGRIFAMQLNRLGLDPTDGDVAVHTALAGWKLKSGADLSFVVAAGNWLEMIWEANQRVGIFDARALARVLGKLWYGVCSANAAIGMPVWTTFESSSLTRRSTIPAAARLGLLVKASMRRG